MSNSQQKPGMNNEALSPFDQTEEIFSDLVEQLKDKEFKTLLEKYNEEFVAAEPTNELTEEYLEAEKEARDDERLQRKCEYARKLSKDIMKRMSGSPDSELFKTAKKVLDLLDEIETGCKSRWRELYTTTYTLVQLCRAKHEKPAEPGGNAAPATIINIDKVDKLGVLGNVQAESVQTGDNSSIHKQTIITEKKKGIIGKILRIIGAVAALLTIVYYLWWLWTTFWHK